MRCITGIGWCFCRVNACVAERRLADPAPCHSSCRSVPSASSPCRAANLLLLPCHALALRCVVLCCAAVEWRCVSPSDAPSSSAPKWKNDRTVITQAQLVSCCLGGPQHIHPAQPNIAQAQQSSWLLAAPVSHPGRQTRFDPFRPSTVARSRQAPGKKAPPPRSLDSGPKIAIWNRPNSRRARNTTVHRHPGTHHSSVPHRTTTHPLPRTPSPTNPPANSPRHCPGSPRQETPPN